jgi:hypothetical protein
LIFFSRTNSFETHWITKEKSISESDFEFYKKVLETYRNLNITIENTKIDYYWAFHFLFLKFIQNKQIHLACEANSFICYLQKPFIKELTEIAIVREYLIQKQLVEAEIVMNKSQGSFVFRLEFALLLYKFRHKEKALAFLEQLFEKEMKNKNSNIEKVQLHYCHTLLKFKETQKALVLLRKISKIKSNSHLKSDILETLLENLKKV